jgi:hypothetical protein
VTDERFAADEEATNAEKLMLEILFPEDTAPVNVAE